MKKLTDLEERFAQAVLTAESQAEAYRQVYKSSNMKSATVRRRAVEVAERPHVAARISELKAERCERTKIDADYVLNRHVEIDQMDFLDILNDDFSFKPISEWPKVWRQFISGFELAELYEGQGDDRKVAGVLKKIKWPDKTANLKQLGMHTKVGAYTEKHEHNIGKSLAELMKEVANE